MTLLNGTMTPIETVTVGSGGTANITFSNIPQTYTDLIIVTSLRATGSYTATSTYMRFNNSTSDRSFKFTTGNGSSIENYGDNLLWAGYETGSTGTNNSFANNYIYITNYAGSNYKSISVDAGYSNNSQTSHIGMAAGLWANSAAITSIQISPYTGSWAQYSTATLYGVATASVGAKATGGAISSDTNYWYHTFTFSGTFTPTQNLTADYLVVAGGAGGGGYHYGAGGGAGGLRSTVTATGGGGSLESALSLTASTNYTVTVGAGGAGGAFDNRGTNGSNSVFSSITSNGGGGGGNGNAELAGASGGSGGGGGASNISSTRLPGSGTANQGYAGGNASTSYSGGASGGGGGAGAVGGDASGTTGGNGGNGVTVAISGSSVTYAGGGGGSTYSGTQGSGGTGGGGQGARNQATTVQATNGTANTGSGGGGANQTNTTTAGAGGSGIVIIRYAK